MIGHRQLDFMIVGAQKCGTTALAAFCAEHPDICMADPKEPHVFDAPGFDPGVVDDRYQACFSHYGGEQLLGEATPIYMYWPEIAGHLHRYNPDLKLIVILRDPVDRAVSHYRMARERNEEQRGLVAAFLLETFRLRADRDPRATDSSSRLHSYLDRGQYRRQIENLQRWFEPDRVLILDSADLLARHDQTLGRVFRFLGVSEEIRIAPRKVFESGTAAPSGLLMCLLRIALFRRSAIFRRLVQ